MSDPMPTSAPTSASTSATTPPAIQALRQAAEGLLFPSERDAPLTTFFWPDEPPGKLTPERVAELAQLPADAKIKNVKLETFFRHATKEEEWHNDEEKAEVRRFQNLIKVIRDTLDEVKVFCVGETDMDAYIVGRTQGGYAGLKTNVVES